MKIDSNFERYFDDFRHFRAKCGKSLAGIASATAFVYLLSSESKGDSSIQTSAEGASQRPCICKVSRADLKASLNAADRVFRLMRDEIDWIQRTALSVSPYLVRRIELGDLNWQFLAEQAKASVQPSTSRLEYFEIVRDLLSELREGHTGVEFSKLNAKERHIPLTFYTTDGRLYIKEVPTYTEDGSLSLYVGTSEPIAIHPHDEVIAINGQSAMDYLLSHTRSLSGKHFSAFDLQRAAHKLLLRSSDDGVEIPDQPIHLKFYSQTEQEYKEVTLEWRPDCPRMIDFAWPLDPLFTSIPEIGERGPVTLGIDSFNCEIATPEDHRIAYFRIDHFGSEPIKQVVDWFSELNEGTEVAIVDLRNNLGGDQEYLFILIGVFISQPIEDCPTSYCLSGKFAQHKSQSLADIIERSLKLDRENLAPTSRKTVQLLIEEEIDEALMDLKEWREGRTFRAMHKSKRRIYPQPTQFDKPLIVLINESSASSSQHFAAVMQDLGRGLIFGTPSAEGSGGVVLPERDESKFKGPYAISSLYLPTADALRVGKDTSDNFQVIPDIHCALTHSDAAGGTTQYSDRLREIVLSLANGQSIAEIRRSFE